MTKHTSSEFYKHSTFNVTKFYSTVLVFTAVRECVIELIFITRHSWYNNKSSIVYAESYPLNLYDRTILKQLENIL